MKNLIFTLAVLFIGTVSVNAQKAFPDDDDFNLIPSYFTSKHVPYFLRGVEYISDYENRVSYYRLDAGNIYDMNFDFVTSFNIEDELDFLRLAWFVDKNGIQHDTQYKLFLTQTFFNNDADWEYIVPVKEPVNTQWGTEFEIVSYTIKKTNGTVLGSISAKSWSGDVYIINDVVYTTIYEGDDKEGTYYFYTLPEFRKLFNADIDGDLAVPAMVKKVSKETHDLMGRRVSNHHKGVVIKDGKKMINK